MAGCKSTKYVGRDVVLEYAIGCGDTRPIESEWLRFGSMRTKEFDLSWETADATADDSIGSLRENLATFQSLTISGDGTCKASGAGSQNLINLTKHVASPQGTAGQPVVWMRMTFPDLTFTAFMLLSTMSRSAPYDDVATYSMEATATASDFGLIVEDTPSATAPVITSVTVVPATKSLTVGQKYTLQAVVQPAGASQSVTWASNEPAEVSVNAATGEITALTDTASVAVITATSVADATKSGSSDVTVA